MPHSPSPDILGYFPEQVVCPDLSINVSFLASLNDPRDEVVLVTVEYSAAIGPSYANPRAGCFNSF